MMEKILSTQTPDIQSLVLEKLSSGLTDEKLVDEILADMGKRDQKKLVVDQLEKERMHREEGIRYYEPFDDPNSQLDAHKSLAFIRMGIGGNKGGKTHWQASEHIWWATRTHPYVETPKPPVHLRWATVDIEDGIKKVAIPKFKELVKREDLCGGSWETAYSKESRTLNYANGSTEEFMSYDQDADKFSGANRHLIGFDEPPPQPIFDECLFRCIKYKGRVTITFTPTEDNPNTGWLYDFYLKAIESNDRDHIEVFSFDPRLNRALDQAWLEKFWSKFTEEQLLSRKLGKFPQFAGLVFKSFSRAKHVVGCFVPPRDWTRYLMIDPHERTPTAVLFLAVNPDGEFFVYDEIFEEGTAKVLVDLINAKVGKDKIEVIWMDEYGKNKDNFKQSSIWQEFVDPDRDGSDKGIFSITVRFTEELKQRGLRIIRDYLGLDKVYQKPRIFFMDNCPLTIREFETAIYDDYKLKSTKPLKETIKKKGIHFIDCLMMALVNNPIYVKLRSPQDDQYRSPYAYLNRSGK